jgi:PmbA protein
MLDLTRIASEAIDSMKRKGADQGQLFVTESETKEFNVDSGELTLFRTLFNEDINVLVYKNSKKGSCFMNKLSEDSVEKALDSALLSSESGVEDECYEIAPFQGDIKAEKGVYEADTDKLFLRTEELINKIKEEYPKVMIQQLIVSHDRRHMVYMNTNNTYCEEYIGSYSVSLTIAGNDGDITTSIIGAGVKTDNLDHPFIELGNIKEQIRVAESQLEAKPFDDKFTGVMILTPGCMETFVSFMAGLVNGGVILDKTSIWIDKLEEIVADPRISLKNDPSDRRIVCGETLTFDGFISEPFDFIKEGVLKNFFIDHYISKKTGYKRALNGSFSMIAEPGEKSIDDIIKQVKKGIIVGEFSGGYPGTNGDFSGVAKNSYLVEDGQVKHGITEAMINGNLAEMLLNLVGVSKEVVANGWDVLPYMAFDGIVVTGK